ncbi:hypothetical protein AWM75_07850 [Aerococcus urinaehominis]|uniref:Uncharacterized protein n=1 Tax=Aerococcus urinaehominis TaxID=128944 RepID=A0A0X8FM87_9LACT|nr:hypothetical protein [Aerococcus urinaehominis]AMB99885.1 hypothetical protein AWM75_07850 [Aerococcus urinaehominis]
MLLFPDWATLTAMTEIDCEPDPAKLFGENNYQRYCQYIARSAVQHLVNGLDHYKYLEGAGKVK